MTLFINILRHTKSLVPPTSELSSHSVCAVITDHIKEIYIFATGENDYFLWRHNRILACNYIKNKF